MTGHGDVLPLSSALPLSPLYSSLTQVLEQEKAQGLELAKELAQLRYKAKELEMLIQDFGPVWKRSPALGRYPSEIRQLKLERYREKRALRLQRYQATRAFAGRSTAAKSRVRVNGKFVKSC